MTNIYQTFKCERNNNNNLYKRYYTIFNIRSNVQSKIKIYNDVNDATC